MAVKRAKSKRKSNGKAARSKTTARKKTASKASARTTSRTKKAKSTSRTKKSTKSTTTSTRKLPAIREPLSKGNLIKTITDATELGRKDVVAVLDCFSQVIEKHVKSGGPGVFVMPGMMKISVVRKPARPARKGVNPFTGEEIMIKAKPAHKVVKIRALKKLKEMVL